MPTRTLLLIVVFAFAVGGCRSFAKTCVGTCVSGYKNTMAGAAEGLVTGRTEGDSIDGANVIASFDALEGQGDVTLMSLEAVGNSANAASAIFVFENASDVPLRITGLQSVALDPEGFALPANARPPELTVPARSKARLRVDVQAPIADVGSIRLWDHDFDVEPEMRKRSKPEQTF